MICHCTDAATSRKQCAGSEVLRERELVRYLVHGRSALAPLHPDGMTLEGVRWVLRALDEERLLKVGLRPYSPWFGALWRKLRSDLSDSGIRHHRLLPPQPGEFRRSRVQLAFAERLRREGVDRERFDETDQTGENAA
jgi:hypothetical protein